MSDVGREPARRDPDAPARTEPLEFSVLLIPVLVALEQGVTDIDNVDPVAAQAAHRGTDAALDIQGILSTRNRRGEKNTLTPAVQRFTQQGLGTPAAGVGGTASSASSGFSTTAA